MFVFVLFCFEYTIHNLIIFCYFFKNNTTQFLSIYMLFVKYAYTSVYTCHVLHLSCFTLVMFYTCHVLYLSCFTIVLARLVQGESRQ